MNQPPIGLVHVTIVSCSYPKLGLDPTSELVGTMNYAIGVSFFRSETGIVDRGFKPPLGHKSKVDL